MKYRQLVQRLSQLGWLSLRQKGGHLILIKGNKKLVIPTHGNKDVSRGVIRHCAKQNNLKVKEF
jgi:predicted RNA binding protein YcfA (HicA-like mRNA interferase family)